ncbi:oxidative stress survival, Svf1-like protein [Jaminaea rosea]|uniref:Oxidative stress survival, Svf1-like protein n=1 Tax=Jaminaea rosea TaxID=1569628 RepID=A0A316UQF2_9BASI|nr:oxidative stress survival, Svf1-like protein [Jaminaea rosea]PWN27516.1 oxidative stress survival, Svf1-like protein [Jaminaea rosea]
MSGWGSWLSGSSASHEKAGSTGSQSGTAAALAPNFHAITDTTPQDKLYGPLEAKDLEWTCAGGFATETQTWYTILKDGSFATSQIIHSGVGLWYPQIQVTFKYFNPKTGQKVWKSVNVTHFTTPPPDGFRNKSKWDKRSSKSDQYSVLFETLADGSEKYTIEANMDSDLQLAYSFTRPKEAQGWKLGAGPEGGKSLFGTNAASPDGYVVHRFWPTSHSSGHFIIKGQAIDATGQGMFVSAIQGMRPNLVASKWNFANFQSEEEGGVQAIMMEFTTTSDYGAAPVKDGEGSQEKAAAAAASGSATPGPARETMTVTIGSITAGGKLLAVVGSTRNGVRSSPRGSSTRVTHQDRTLDADTGYQAPQSIQYVWEGPALASPSAVVKASTTVALGKPSPVSEAKGLVDKVDVLAEIPYMVRKIVNYVAGTKPYIYQTLNPTTLELDDGSGSKKEVKGTLFEEHTFISSVAAEDARQ